MLHVRASARHRHAVAGVSGVGQRTGLAENARDALASVALTENPFVFFSTPGLLLPTRLLTYPLALAALGPHPGGCVGVCFGVEDVPVAVRGRSPGRANELEESVGSRRIHGKGIEVRLAVSDAQHVGPGLTVAVGGRVDEAYDLPAGVLRIVVAIGIWLRVSGCLQVVVGNPADLILIGHTLEAAL